MNLRKNAFQSDAGLLSCGQCFISLMTSDYSHVAVYGYARATLDIDIFVKPTRLNIRRVMQALRQFGYDLADFDEADFLTHKVLIRQHLLETDIHPFVKGVTFEEIWKNKISGKIGKAEVFFPSLADMIRMKKAANRPKDREDLKYLRKLAER